MTRLEVEIGDLVLRGLPASYGEGFGSLVEQRLSALARGEDLPEIGPERGPEHGPETLAAQVAQQVWAQVRTSTQDVWGGRS